MIPKSKEFLALQAEWDKKLKDSGFKEIEDRRSPDEALIKWDSFYFQARYTPEIFKAKEEYFSRAISVLETYTFSCWLSKAVWQNHAAGLSLREIVRKLRTKENKLNKDKAASFIRQIKKEVWGEES